MVGNARGSRDSCKRVCSMWFEIQVRIAEGVHEVAGFQAAHLRHHHGEQGVAGDVERHAEEDVGAALVELAGELAVRHIELEEGMAGRQRHLGRVRPRSRPRR